jgi:hypothetical protein
MEPTDTDTPVTRPCPPAVICRPAPNPKTPRVVTVLSKVRVSAEAVTRIGSLASSDSTDNSALDTTHQAAHAKPANTNNTNTDSSIRRTVFTLLSGFSFA